MLVVPNSSFPLLGNSLTKIIVNDTKNVNSKPGLGLHLSQLWFNIAMNIAQAPDFAYDAYITVNSEPVALLTGKVGISYSNVTNGDVTTGMPTQFIITYTPPVPIAQRDNIVFEATLTAKNGQAWLSNSLTWSYMLNFA